MLFTNFNLMSQTIFSANNHRNKQKKAKVLSKSEYLIQPSQNWYDRLLVFVEYNKEGNVVLVKAHTPQTDIASFINCYIYDYDANLRVSRMLMFSHGEYDTIKTVYEYEVTDNLYPYKTIVEDRNGKFINLYDFGKERVIETESTYDYQTNRLVSTRQKFTDTINTTVSEIICKISSDKCDTNIYHENDRLYELWENISSMEIVFSKNKKCRKINTDENGLTKFEVYDNHTNELLRILEFDKNRNIQSDILLNNGKLYYKLYYIYTYYN